jgi:hypothetical protein
MVGGIDNLGKHKPPGKRENREKRNKEYSRLTIIYSLYDKKYKKC